MMKFPQCRFPQLPVPLSQLVGSETGTWWTAKNQQKCALSPSTVCRNCYLDSGYRGLAL